MSGHIPTSFFLLISSLFGATIRLGQVHEHHSSPSKKLGYTIAVRRTQEQTNGGHIDAKKVRKQGSGGIIPKADKINMMLILYRVRALLIRVKAIKWF